MARAKKKPEMVEVSDTVEVKDIVDNMELVEPTEIEAINTQLEDTQLEIIEENKEEQEIPDDHKEHQCQIEEKISTEDSLPLETDSIELKEDSLNEQAQKVKSAEFKPQQSTVTQKKREKIEPVKSSSETNVTGTQGVPTKHISGTKVKPTTVPNSAGIRSTFGLFFR